MRSSILLAATGALLAAAGPILQERGRLIVETEVVEEWVTVTVTAGRNGRYTPKATKFRQNSRPKPTTTSSSITSSSIPPPPPSSTAPVVAEVFVPPVVEAPPPPPVVEAPPPAPIPEPVIEAPAPPPAPVAPAPPPVQQAPSGGDYESTLLFHHNVHRANHSSGDLTWDSNLASYALQTAQKCVFAHDM